MELNVIVTNEFLSKSKADELFEKLNCLDFKPLTVKIKNKSFTPKRRVLAFADSESLHYQFSGTCVKPQLWPDFLLQLKRDVESFTSLEYNFALVNFYQDGSVGISKHADNENGLCKKSGVACISVGAVRTLNFYRMGESSRDFKLNHGSLYVMLTPTNQLYTHGIKHEAEVKQPRISITFRKIVESSGPPPCKRRRLYEDPDPEDAVKYQWHINYATKIYVCYDSVSGTRIHIRKMDVENQTPSKEGIVMTPATWICFLEKLVNFNTMYKNASFIANNQLAVFVEKGVCILKQVFPLSHHNYKMSTNCISLNNEQLTLIHDHSEEINQCVLETLYGRELVAKLIAKPCASPVEMDLEEVKQTVLNSVVEEVCQCLNNLFYCEGCVWDNPSQTRHPCILQSTNFKLFTVGDKVFYFINIQNIVNVLPDSDLYSVFENYTFEMFKEIILEKLDL